MIPNLPEQFQEAMKQLLGTQEYPAFLASYDRPVRAGIRVNTLKCNIAEFMENAPFHLEAIPWIENGFYYDEADAPSHHPWYYAGMFYLPGTQCNDTGKPFACRKRGSGAGFMCGAGW